ncbi:hypothetical protein G6F70_006768 [Rhizopus microsporus]|nr:hypothetical protein G6F70_006768 [Rhizopus microsporus]KAG1212655.1 hypothetical protein G6F69_003509 [Rhizopus microsporus]KAG1267674.1 hypothetical protein G6F68_001713 [Rhizopus microsporus]
MSSIVEIMRKRLMDSIRSVQPPSKWKIIVVDSKSTHILNAACKMYDILEENVTRMSFCLQSTALLTVLY